MEKLEGILIATTNLEGNLDAAFERRFLFKIRYEKPSLSEADARTLASGYDFSGGEIDNIVRKATMEEVISGREPSLSNLVSFCEHERLAGSGRGARIGF